MRRNAVIIILTIACLGLVSPTVALACDHPKTATRTVPQICDRLIKAEEMLSTEGAAAPLRRAVLIEGLKALREIYSLPPAVRKLSHCNGIMVPAWGLSFGNDASVEHFAARLLSGAIPAGVDVSSIFKQEELTRFAARNPYAAPPAR